MALKEGKELEASVLRLLKAAILNKEKEKRYKLSKDNPGSKDEQLDKESLLSSEESIDVVSSEIKKRREAIELYDKGNRPELAEKEKKEVEILQKFLPEQISEDEIRKIVAEAVSETGASQIKEMGKVMGIITPQLKGKADMSVVSRIVKESLS